MIKVFFPPGCYGTYFARCIYNFSNLRIGAFENFKFIDDGSSHKHRTDADAFLVIQQGHVESLTYEQDDQLIVVLPCQDHQLDYYNNQFFKQQHGQLINYIQNQMSPTDIEHKLKTQWGYHGSFDDAVPRWIMREWCSFWIADVLNISYNVKKYHNLDSIARVHTQDIFENFIDTLIRVISKLGLTVSVDIDTINKQHSKFLSLQKFHNSQHRCVQYVNDILSGNIKSMTLLSIFDEAYIQHLLRQHNLEIQCDGLDTFPITTQDLKILTYDNSNYNN